MLSHQCAALYWQKQLVLQFQCIISNDADQWEDTDHVNELSIMIIKVGQNWVVDAGCQHQGSPPGVTTVEYHYIICYYTLWYWASLCVQLFGSWRRRNFSPSIRVQSWPPSQENAPQWPAEWRLSSLHWFQTSRFYLFFFLFFFIFCWIVTECMQRQSECFCGAQ